MRFYILGMLLVLYSQYGTSSSQGNCQDGAAKAHPGHCGWYLRCASGQWKQKSCYFPKLWSTVTKTCTKYKEVTCGARKEPKRPCDYGPTFLLPSHSGVSCHLNHPNCLDKPDGLYPTRDCSYYFRCQDGRNLKGNLGCPLPTDHALGKNSTFDPRTCKCTAPCYILQDSMSRYPKCPGCVRNGNYADIEKCGEYHVCQDGAHLATVKCPGGLWFNSAGNYCDWPTNFSYRRQRQCRNGK